MLEAAKHAEAGGQIGLSAHQMLTFSHRDWGEKKTAKKKKRLKYSILK